MEVNNNSAQPQPYSTFSYIKSGAYYLTFPLSAPIYYASSYFMGSKPKDIVKEFEGMVRQKGEMLLQGTSEESRIFLDSCINTYLSEKLGVPNLTNVQKEPVAQVEKILDLNPQAIEPELLSHMQKGVHAYFTTVFNSLTEKMDVSLEGQKQLEKLKSKLDLLYKTDFHSVKEMEELVIELQKVALEVNAVYFRESIRMLPTDEEFIVSIEGSLKLRRKGIEKSSNALFIAMRDFMGSQMDFYKKTTPQELRVDVVNFIEKNLQEFENIIKVKLEQDAQAIQSMKHFEEFEVKMAKYDPQSPVYIALYELFENRHEAKFSEAVNFLKGRDGIQLYLESMKLEGTAPTEVELWAFSELYGVGVCAYHPLYPEGKLGNDLQPALHVVKTDDIYFDLLV